MADNAQSENASIEIVSKKKTVKSEIYVLEKNFGAIIERVHQFWEKGEEFIVGKDDEMIAFFHRAGAAIKPKK
ncbi:MAG: hypothetical protein ACYC0Z_13130 [Acidobacteriaceae bacterium]